MEADQSCLIKEISNYYHMILYEGKWLLRVAKMKYRMYFKLIIGVAWHKVPYHGHNITRHSSYQKLFTYGK